jgi:uncharacterized protein DUF350
LNEFRPAYLLNGLLYAAAGIVLLFAALAAAGRLAGVDLRKELCENRNVAVAILALALAIIIAAALH